MTQSTVQRAEALLRSLVGITAAEVRLSTGGRVERVRVATACALSNGQVVQNVRSALFAGLGVRIDPAQIELVDAKAWVETAAPEPGSEAGTAAGHPGAASRAPNGNGTGNGNGAGHGNGNGNGNGSHAGAPMDEVPLAAHRASALELAAPAVALPAAVVTETVNGHGRREVAPAPVARIGITVAGVDLRSVELLRQTGRLRCRVVLAAGDQKYSAIADAAEDTPEFQLAARVTCDALRAAQLTSAHFDGASVAYLAGRAHVVVALSDWRAGSQFAGLSGSAVVTDRLEQAAAVAVLQALRGTY